MRNFFAAAVAVLLFAAGFSCRHVLGDWLVQIHTGSLEQQCSLIVLGLSRVALTAVLLTVFVLLFVLLLWFSIAVLTEGYYQLFRRRVLSQLAQKMDIPDMMDERTPKQKPVNARKYASRGSNVREEVRRGLASRVRSVSMAMDTDKSEDLDWGVRVENES